MILFYVTLRSPFLLQVLPFPNGPSFPYILPHTFPRLFPHPYRDFPSLGHRLLPQNFALPPLKPLVPSESSAPLCRPDPLRLTGRLTLRLPWKAFLSHLQLWCSKFFTLPQASTSSASPPSAPPAREMTFLRRARLPFRFLAKNTDGQKLSLLERPWSYAKRSNPV